MQIILMTAASVLVILFLVQMKRGAPYAPMTENLDGNLFPMSELYTVGFAWASGPLALKGNREENLRDQAAMLYDPQYAEYYANVVWAETLTLGHLFFTLTLLFAAIVPSAAGAILLMGTLMSVAVAGNALQGMKDSLTKRTVECEAQLPEVVSTMAVLVNSGMVLRDAWNMVAQSQDGAFYQLMRRASEDMRNGHSDGSAILMFGKASNSLEIKKFTSALLQSMDKGGAELSAFLAHQSTELWNAKRQRMIQGGEKAATKLLLPIVLIFVGVVIIVITAAFAGMLF